MSHFAEIDSNGVVLRVIVAEQNFINSGVVGDSFNWVQTSYNNNFVDEVLPIYKMLNQSKHDQMVSENYYLLYFINPDKKEIKPGQGTSSHTIINDILNILSLNYSHSFQIKEIIKTVLSKCFFKFHQ